MIRWNGTQWSREPVELPGGYAGSFHDRRARRDYAAEPVAARAAPAPESGLGAMLFKRVVNGSGEGRWEYVELGSALFAQAATPAQDVSDVSPLGSPGQPLTASDQGVWIDGNLQAPDGGSRRVRLHALLRHRPSQGHGQLVRRPQRAAGKRCAPIRWARASAASPATAASPSTVPGSARASSPTRCGPEAKTRRTWAPTSASKARPSSGCPARVPTTRPAAPSTRPSDGWLEGPVQITGNGRARAADELARVRARAVHRRRPGARDGSGRPERPGAGRRRRRRRRPLHPRAGLAAGVPADEQRRGQLADAACRRLAGTEQGVRRR